MRASVVVAAAFGLLLLARANAQTCFTLEARDGFSDRLYSPEAIDSAFANLPGALCTRTDIAVIQGISVPDACPGVIASGSHVDKYTFTFTVASPLTIQFEFGIDFGLGSYVKIDGNVEFFTSDDMWWNLDWNNNQVIRITKSFAPGQHSVVVAGSEGCCNGPVHFRFKINNGPFTAFTCDALDDGLISAVPHFLPNFPAVASVSDSSVTVSIASDIPADAICTVVQADQPQPTRPQISSLDWWGASAQATGSSSTTPSSIVLSNLLCGVNYKVYCSLTADGTSNPDAEVFAAVQTFTTTGAGCFAAPCDADGSCTSSVEAEGNFVSLAFHRPQSYNNAVNNCN